MRGPGWLLVSCALLASCGGDGGSTGSSAVSSGGSTTSSSPTPTPTTSATSSGQTLLNLTSDQAFEGFFGSNGYYRDQAGAVSGQQDIYNGVGNPVTYISSSKTFKFTNSIYLLPKNIDINAPLYYNASASDPGYAVYTGQSNGATLSIRELIPGSSNPVLPLVYTSLAIAKASYADSSTGLTDLGVTPQAYGILYKYDQTKLTGSGDYSGIILGQARGNGSTHAYDLSGTITLTINYDTTAFTGQLHVIATDDVSGQKFDLGIFPLAPPRPRGTLDAFSAVVTGTDQFQGLLGGPMGEEFIGGFDAHLPDPQAPSITMKISAVLAAKK